MELGTVISTFDGPSPSSFDFVLTDKAHARKNQFVELESAEGKLIGRITDIKKANRYFERAESVREYEKHSSSMETIFPTGRWEFTVASVNPLGVYSETALQKPCFPPSPGTKVFLAKDEILSKFLGLDTNGIFLGNIEHHNLNVRLNMKRLLQKHLAILAMSGAGKSYLTSVVLEELMERDKKQGRIGVVVIDVHGEYSSLAEPVKQHESYKDYSAKCKVIDGQEIKIGVPNLSTEELVSFVHGLTLVQKRVLSGIIDTFRKKQKKGEGTYNLMDIIKYIEADEKIKENTKEPLVGWLFELYKTGLFADIDFPSVHTLVKPGHVSILDLNRIIASKKKQIIVSYLLNKLFNLRRNGHIPPFLVVLEEAHQFVPEGIKTEHALSKHIIETIAREGRKFYASLCLISQRPVRLSTTVLSQCNTHIILRVTNPYDLEHIKQSSEGITQDTLESISTLPVGEGLVVGEAVNYPIFVRIRRRNSQESGKGMDLEKAALQYEILLEKQGKDADAFI